MIRLSEQWSRQCSSKPRASGDDPVTVDENTLKRA